MPVFGAIHYSVRDNGVIVKKAAYVILGLTGIKEAISAAFPKTDYQRCMVHMVRNTLKYVASKDMKSFAADLKTIYNAVSEDEGQKTRDRVVEKWSSSPSMAIAAILFSLS